jgi:hypothetical protein
VVSRFGVHLIQLIERRQEKLTEREQREMVRNVVRERKAERDARPKTLSELGNADLAVRADRFPELLDFYSTFDELDVTPDDRERFKRLVARLGARDAALLDTTLSFTIVRFASNGGIPTPLPVTLTYADGTT